MKGRNEATIETKGQNEAGIGTKIKMRFFIWGTVLFFEKTKLISAFQSEIVIDV